MSDDEVIASHVPLQYLIGNTHHDESYLFLHLQKRFLHLKNVLSDSYPDFLKVFHVILAEKVQNWPFLADW